MDQIVSFLSTAKGKTLVVGLLFLFMIYFGIKSQIKKNKIIKFEQMQREKEKERKRRFY